MAQYGSNSLVIEFHDSGGTLRDMSNYVREFNGVTKEALLQESHAFGDAWFESAFTGMSKLDDVTMGGYYNDAASTGPDVIFNAIGSTRTLKVTWGSTKTTSVSTVIKKYARMPVLNELHKFQVIVTPTGQPTEV